MYLFGGLFCSVVPLSCLQCTCAAPLLYGAFSPFSCVDQTAHCTGSVCNGNAQLCFSCLSFFLHFQLLVLPQECIEYASAVSAFQGLVVSVPFPCLVAPFCLIAFEKSTQYRIAPECTSWCRRAVSLYNPSEDLSRFPCFHLVLLCGLGLVLLCRLRMSVAFVA